ncbi:hypothetical protein BGZ82_001959, partial [Podila clonocystis]
MTDDRVSLFCLVDGEATANAFSIKIPSNNNVDDLKDLIKAKIPDTFNGVDAKDLTLWRVSIPVVPANKHKPIVLNEFESATELDPTDDISDVFAYKPLKKTIHIIVQRPPRGDLRVDIKKITNKFFAPGTPITDFLNAFVRGQRNLPVTTHSRPTKSMASRPRTPDIGDDQLTLVTCGTGLSINTLFWIQSSGSGLKDSSTNFEERVIESNDRGAWKKTIEDAEDRLVSWAHRHIKGNLCYEISRLHDKHNKYKDQLVESIDSMLGLLMYQRCMFGNHDLVLKEVDPQLVEHAFGRIKIIQGRAVTVMDEPFVSKAVENYFAAIDPYFAREVQKRMVKSTAIEQGCVFERFMMKVFSESFNTRPLSEWPHQPPISDMCPALVGKVEIVGWREPGLEQGTTHGMMSMEEFMDAHVNHGSTHNNLPVAPFFFPKSKPSGPDLVFIIRIDGTRLVPVFVQLKLHQGSSNFSERDWNDALSTVSAPKIEGH